MTSGNGKKPVSGRRRRVAVIREANIQPAVSVGQRPTEERKPTVEQERCDHSQYNPDIDGDYCSCGTRMGDEED